MKKIAKTIIGVLSVLFFTLITMVVFSACNTDNSNGKINIVCTVFPQYDWVKQIVGECDNVQIELLMQNGTDMHSYELTFSDMVKISNADVFIYVGGESDQTWVNKALANATNKNIVKVNLMEVLGNNVLDEEIQTGMQIEDEHEEEAEKDEHVWLSLKNVSLYVEHLAKKLGEIDVDNKQTYIDNANAYLHNINALDTEYEKAVELATNKTLVIADRFALRYLVQDYSLNYYAAFPGCSTEVNASAQTITFLASVIDNNSIKNIIKIDGSNGSVAKAVKEATTSKNQNIVEINTMQTITSGDIRGGKTYLSIMRQNLEVLKGVLTNE